ncbi:IclR family transcriptional regulator [Halomonas urumqiensis]|uniref:HTH-type transcriptional repressor AllR n=1 Tax=Halomonas urumqiensis TaxID=1684789 RepID=A0A2N7UMU8_9GAMM|nr:IclR family transcriptional regulator [Halomonas urumqiensis]PMR81732.1 IclR family transcriptional regulator [Halomonas urumqiensis]PTB02369.1 IclR family transcriptional regulator [Halomonas urumqiensis]GHE21851.1 transcriptional regulator [Halomonas urumqiensis]
MDTSDPANVSSASEKSPVQGTAAVAKGLRLLKLIAKLDSNARSRDIQQASGLPRPTVHRLLNTLEHEGFVERNPMDGVYVIGRQLLQITQQARSQHSLPKRLHATLEAIGSASGETVHLAVPAGCHMTFIDKVESPEAVRMASYIGMPVPMHSTSVGKAYLAALPLEVRERYLDQLTLEAVTPRTITDRGRLADELALTASRGYSVDDEENEAGIICFGRAILDPDGTPSSAVSVSVPRYRLPTDGERTISSLIARLCEESGFG